MATNRFESSRISEGTLLPGAQHDGNILKEPKAISRDDVRDGVIEPQPSEEIDNMIAEGGPAAGGSAPPMKTPPGAHRLIAAGTVAGNHVRNLAGEELGRIEDLMIDLNTGRIIYAVLSFGGFLGIGDRRYPVPWSALRIHAERNELILDLSRSDLEKAPAFEKDSWPDMASPSFDEEIRAHYGRKPN
jgi:sporulation protein YlmC with PRC-barrel domain